MRLIDADAIKIPKVEPDLYEDCSRCKMYSECDFYDFLDQAPTVDLWKYPSKGEYPTEGEETLIIFKHRGEKVFKVDKYTKGGWLFSPKPIAWQYIVPPKEEA